MKTIFVRSLLVLCGLTIVVFLLLFLVPLSHVPHSHGNAVKAENTAYNLKNAISAYFTEYREYPVQTESGDTTVDSGHALMDILMGSDKEAGEEGANRRRIAFYTGRRARKLDDGRFQKGITLDKDGGGELWDPWANHYRVRLDTDLDNRIENPELPGQFLPESIMVWSAGKDGDFETWKDNIKTW